MFSPRGNLPQRPRAPNPSGSRSQGAFRGGGITGFQRNPAPGTPQGIQQRFVGHETLQRTGSRRTNVQVTQHRTDPRQAKEIANLQNEQREKTRTSRWDNSPCPTGNRSRKHHASTRIAEQNTSIQSRYTTESASSILASFGLSNEDLEELSRYPDDQLTPENMPLILRDIRMRKMGHQLPNVRSQSREKETVGGTGGSTVKSKVIDYGHTSRYGYTEDPLEVRVYNPDEPAGENRKFQPQQTISVPPSNATCNPMFPVEELIKQMGFHSESSNTQSFFPVNDAGKVPELCVTPTGLPVVKPVAQSAMPPVMPNVMPPMSQSGMAPTVQQSLTQPPMAQTISHSEFSNELLAAVRRHERMQRESGTSQSNAQIGSGQKNFQTQVEGPIKSPFGVVKASWLPVFSQVAAQKIKRLPTPSMMNDYYATSPRIFPHMCSLCNVECTHMKDWIQHQNNPAHLESCRQLRQQYPDWNPEAHSSKRNEGDRKENQTPKRRSSSGSPGRRHSRGSGSGHILRRSRSRSPGRFRLARPRSRSPRQIRRLSPRYRSRSPQRSRNPLRSSPRPQRSASNEWTSRRTARSPVKSWGASFSAESNKQKSLQAAGQGSSGIGKVSPARGISGPGKISGTMKKPLSAAGHHRTLKKDLSSVPGSATSKMKSETVDAEEERDTSLDEKATKETSVPRPYNRLLREKLLSCGTVLHISDLPDDGFSDQDIKKIVQPFGKVSDLLVLRSRNEAFLEMNYKEAVVAAVKFGETVPVLVNGKRVKISIAEKPRTPPGEVKVSLKKTTQNVKKAALSTKKDGNSATIKKTKTTTAAASAARLTKTGQIATKAVKLAGKHEVTKKTAVQADSKTKKTSAISAKASEKKHIDPKKSAESKKKDAKTKKVAEAKQTESKMNIESKKAVEAKATTESKQAGEDETKEMSELVALPEEITLTPMVEMESNVESTANKASDSGSWLPDKLQEEATVESTKSEESTEPASKELDDTCVVLISNLPDKGYSVEEVSNLTKPFGGLKDILILSSHKKAYLEITQKSADSMVKFYTCFPMSMDGNQLCITMAPEYKNIKDEEAIFTAIIKDGNSKVNTETLYNQFVHLGNLPDDGYTELEVVCVGLRFGKVDHYVVLKNKKKAILQLDSPDSAESMCCFLKQFPYNMCENTLTCNLSPRREPVEAEVTGKKLKNQEPNKGSSDLKKTPEGSGVVQTAAANPPVDPSVAKEEIISNSVKAETSTVQIETTELEPESTVPAGRISRNSKTGSSGSVKPKEEEELFPFNLDEFVTVDEVVEETDSPVQTRRNPPRGKRKDSAKNSSSSEPVSKRKKGKSSIAHVAESELSFVTLDEIGEEEEVTAQVQGDSNLESITDPQGLVTVDEVNEEELISEAVKDPQSLVTLDEISEQEDFSSHDIPKDISSSVYEEQDLLKAEPLVTVDEIGEVEELPLNEPTDLNIEETLKPKEEDDRRAIEDPGDFISSQLPEDPSNLVTVDEIQEDSDDQPLETLDEVTEDEDDFLADFNRLKEELNFVTVDEVGEEDEEEEENTFIGKKLEEEEEEDIVAIAGPEEEDIVAIAGPEEMEILTDIEPEEEDYIANSKSEEKTTLETDTKEVENETLVADTQEVVREILTVNTEEVAKTEIWNKTSEKEREGETEGDQPEELSLNKAHESNEMETQTKSKQQLPVKIPGKRGRPRKRPIVPPPQAPTETEQEKCNKDNKEEADKIELVESSTSDSNKEEIQKGTLTTLESSHLSEDSQTAAVKEPVTESLLPSLNASLLPDADIKQEGCCEMPSSSEETVTGGTEPESKRRKVDSSADKSKTSSTPKGLDFLVPKAGYFCQICSLFCADEISMKNHCKTQRHQQNMERFMAKQKDADDDEEEELTSR
ncbi:zinc finger protein 638 isoform X5 [Carettochelys insculpta]|uniref:zinc finger protein 638 isoform X5 n=1 Tax=Carettochelys insculpta TaxID=44489 RepID=UPI003EC0356A